MTRNDYIKAFRAAHALLNKIRASYGAAQVDSATFVASCRSYVAGQQLWGAAHLTKLDTPADWCAVADELCFEARDRADDLRSDPL